MAKLPIFAAGKRSNIQPAINAGILGYPSYVFCTDDNHLIFIDKNNQLQDMVGDNPKQVEFVTELPEVADAKTDVLYVKDAIVYVFDGTEYKSMYQDYTTQINELVTRMDSLETSVEAVTSNVTELGSKIETVETNVGTITTNVSEIQTNVSTIESNITNLQNTVETIEQGSSGLVFSYYAEFPETGEANKIYIDESETTGGIYAYDEVNNTYVKLSSSESSSSVKFIELDEDTEESTT